MRRSTFEPQVYAALAGRSRSRRSNREVARLLGVNEATVRRGLERYEETLRDRKRAKDRALLQTEKGRARARRFRLNEFLKRTTPKLEDA